MKAGVVALLAVLGVARRGRRLVFRHGYDAEANRQRLIDGGLMFPNLASQAGGCGEAGDHSSRQADRHRKTSLMALGVVASLHGYPVQDAKLRMGCSQA